MDAYTDKGLQLNYQHSDISVFTKDSEETLDGFEAVSHWHCALEFFCVRSGRLEIFVNGECVRVEAGQGIFINSRRIHYSYSTSEDCSYFLALLDFASVQEQNSLTAEYLKRKFGWSTADYLLLHPEVPWEKEVLDALNVLHKELHDENMNPFRVISAAGYITAVIGDNIPETESDSSDYDRNEFLDMTMFISTHYHEHITLDDIAEAGGICRSKCCEIFKKQIRQSPNNYLIQYRIAKSCEMLKNTDLSIAEIAKKCGFSTASYFTNVFQKHTGTIPRAYRIKNSDRKEG